MREVKNPNKRAKGEGTWYQRSSDGMWVASIELPSPDGKRRRKVVVAKTENQVKAKLKEIKTQLAKHNDLPTSGQTVGTWVEYWFKNIALAKVRPRTAATYRSMVYNYIVPSIGKVRLDKLTPIHVRRLHSFILTKPKDPDDLSKGLLSSTTALQTHRILTVALKYAERDKLVTRNVALDVDAPLKSTKEAGILTAADGVKVLQEVAGDRLGSRWAAALLTGARQGEILGLELDRVTDVLDLSWQLQRISWEHGCAPTCGRKRGVDCPDRKITMPPNWEYRRLEGGLLLSRPKSDSGWRIIPLVDPLASIIQRRIEVAQSEPNPHGLVWTADAKQSKGGARAMLELDGSPIDPGRDNKAWHAILKRAGVDDVRLHDARHTTASLLLEANVPEPIIMKILGHSSYVVTRGYQNVDKRQLSEAMSKMSALMPLN